METEVWNFNSASNKIIDPVLPHTHYGFGIGLYIVPFDFCTSWNHELNFNKVWAIYFITCSKHFQFFKHKLRHVPHFTRTCREFLILFITLKRYCIACIVSFWESGNLSTRINCPICRRLVSIMIIDNRFEVKSFAQYIQFSQVKYRCTKLELNVAQDDFHFRT